MKLIVMVTVDDFLSNSKTFLRQLGLLLHAVVQIKKDQDGNYMVYPYVVNTVDRAKRSTVLSNKVNRKYKREVPKQKNNEG